MKSKTCTKCGKTSYSTGADPWICPYCGKDLTKIESN